MTYPLHDPNQPPQYNQWPQGGPPRVQRKSRSGLIAGIAIGVAVTVLALMAWGYYSANKTADAIRGEGGPYEVPTSSSGSGGGNAQYPTKLSPEAATGDQFANQDADYPFEYSTAEQMDFAGPRLNTNQQSAVERIQAVAGSSSMTGDDGVTQRVIADPSISNTPQQILDQITVGTFRAWEAAQYDGVEYAKKLAAGVADPEYREWQDQVIAFDNKVGNVTNGVAWGELPMITTGSYQGVAATSNNPVMQFKVTSAQNTNSRVTMVVRFDTGTINGSNRWRLVLTKNVG